LILGLARGTARMTADALALVDQKPIIGHESLCRLRRCDRVHDRRREIGRCNTR
jgi:hypothetical protein